MHHGYKPANLLITKLWNHHFLAGKSSCLSSINWPLSIAMLNN